MAFGDRLVADGQIEWGGCLIDSAGWRGSPAAEAVIPPSGVTGLALPEMKPLRTPVPMGHGSFAGLDRWGTRKIALTGVQVDKTDPTAHARLLATMAPRGPSNEQEIGWQGFQWPSGRKFRAWARPDRPADVFDAPVALGRIAQPDLSWECSDPFAYAWDLSELTLAPGGSGTATSIGNWETTRITVTWNGPITAPGITSSAIPGGSIWFATLSLAGGQFISARFHQFIGRTFTSNYWAPDQMWKAAIGAGPSVAYPPPKFFPLIPGDQTITALGSGGGSMVVDWRDAWATPATP